MTEPTNTIPTPYQSGMLKPCPFCGRNMKYKELQWAFVWDVFIEHDYDKSKLFTPCPMKFYRHIEWRNRNSGEIIKEEFVNTRKQRFVEDWNRRVSE